MFVTRLPRIHFKAQHRLLSHRHVAVTGLSEFLTEVDIIEHPAFRDATDIEMQPVNASKLSRAPNKTNKLTNNIATVEFRSNAAKKQCLLQARRILGNANVENVPGVGRTIKARKTSIPMHEFERKRGMYNFTGVWPHHRYDGICVDYVPEGVGVEDFKALELEGYVETYLFSIESRKSSTTGD